MHPADSFSMPSSVKLFPRLAATKVALRPKPKRLFRSAAPRPVDRGMDSSETARSEVRERLLRMIVQNEQVRRNEQRPNAS